MNQSTRTSHRGFTTRGLMTALVYLGGAIGVAALGAYIGTYGIGYQAIVVLITTMIGVGIIVAGRRGFQAGLFLWIFLLALGYRTLPLTPTLRLHPAEIVIWGLLALLLVQHMVMPDRRLDLWLPRWVLLLIPFWIWGWWLGLDAGRPWDLMFAELRNFLLFIPLIYVVAAVLRDSAAWFRALLVFYSVSTWIALWGVLEYLFPGVARLFPSFITDATPFLTGEGFTRARFSFWGTPAATFICVLAAPFAGVLWARSPRIWQRVLILAALAVQVFAVYIGGYRSMWMLLGLAFAVWALLRRGPILTSVLLGLTLGAYQLLPSTTQQRADSLLAVLAGQPIDTSGEKRWDRAIAAFDIAWQTPGGIGWGGAGWVHSDFIQLAANLGLLAGIIFLGAYLLTLWRLWKQVRSPQGSADALGLALLLSFGVAGGILTFEGVQVLPQLVLPVWLVWALAEIWLRQRPNAPLTLLNHRGDRAI